MSATLFHQTPWEYIVTAPWSGSPRHLSLATQQGVLTCIQFDVSTFFSLSRYGHLIQPIWSWRRSDWYTLCWPQQRTWNALRSTSLKCSRFDLRNQDAIICNALLHAVRFCLNKCSRRWRLIPTIWRSYAYHAALRHCQHRCLAKNLSDIQEY